jgi:hypothetical protein
MKSIYAQNTFVSGVLDPRLKGRTDLQQYFQGLETGENVFLLPQGGLRQAPGTVYIETLPEKFGGGVSDVRTFDFPVSDTRQYLVVFVDDKIRIYRDQVFLVEITSADTTDGICDLRDMDGSHTGVNMAAVLEDNTQTWLVNEFVGFELKNVPDLSSTTITANTATTATGILAGGTNNYWGTLDAYQILSPDNVMRNRFANFTINEWVGETIVNLDTGATGTVTANTVNTVTAIMSGGFRNTWENLDRYAIGAPLYTQGNIDSINAAQLDNVMIFTEPTIGLRRLIAPLEGVDDSIVTNWVFDIPPIVGPLIDYNDVDSPTPVSDIQTIGFVSGADGDTFKLILNGITTEDIVFTDILTSKESLMKNIQRALENHPLTSGKDIAVTDAGVGLVKIEFSDSSASDFDDMSGYFTRSASAGASIQLTAHDQVGVSRKEPAWSDGRGYPRAITFYNGRTYLGGLKSRQSSLFGSVSGDLLNFKLGTDDDEGIFVTLATDRLNEITNLISGRQLQIFTSGGEFYVPTEIPTPNNFEARAQTNHGTGFVNPVQIDGSTVFLERKGKTLRDFVFTFQEDSYLANSLSVLAQQLIIAPVDMDAQKGTQADDANYIFIINSDGSLAVLNTLRSQQIAGFTSRQFLNGKAIEVSVVDDIAHFVIEREIDGTTVRYLEYFTFDTLLDAAFKMTYGVPTDTITGLSHLEGQTVKVIADGAVLLDNVVTGGQITIERETTTVDVGLWQSPIIKPMPLAGNGGTGDNSMRIKKITRTSIRLFESSSLQFENVTIPTRGFGTSGNSPLNTPPPIFTGVVGDLESNEGWLRELSPVITQEQPGKFTILAITYEMEAR